MSVEANEDENVKVVIRQNLLKVDEVFIYGIPPMKTSSGHRAEDWDLAKPLATCSLDVERRDDTCVISFLTAKPKEGGPEGSTEPSLFAQSQISLEETPMQHWVEAVVDSSRYFAVRISDGKREAHIGMGFRERDDASNFKMSLLDYENSIMRERKGAELHMAFEEEEGSSDGKADAAGMPQVSKLTLKEGEKIHINLKGTPSKPRKERQKHEGKAKATLLRKPPPPPTETAVENAVSVSEMELVQSASMESTGEDSSECAVVDAEDVDDDEWGDFEGSAT